MTYNKKLQIRNSTAEFLIFTKQSNGETIEVRVADETVWLTQKMISELFDKSRTTITEHLQNIFTSGELEENSVCRDFRHTGSDGKEYLNKFYNLYSTALDYSPDDATSKKFFATVQNKIHLAVHGNTAAEVIMNRADSQKQYMGLTTWRNAPQGKIVKTDVVVAKNYLTQKELTSLERFITMYLDYAEDQAERSIPMTMIDWATKLDVFLQFNQREVLNNPGKVSATIAKSFAESEFEKYRIIQDRLFESDFDKLMKSVNCDATNHNENDSE
jgi:hypothetical protein